MLMIATAAVAERRNSEDVGPVSTLSGTPYPGTRTSFCRLSTLAGTGSPGWV